MGVIEFWYEFGSTYSYPAAMRIEPLAAEAGVSLRWRPFLLGTIFRPLGWNESPFNIFPAKGRYMWRDLERVCPAEGLPLKLPPVKFPQNGLKAARLALIGEEGGWTPAFTRAVFAANYEVGSASRSLARSLTLALFSCPQAAMMSRPRGLRTGLA
jgi:2-hydroxychromene-2-carboxylate isomerase